MRRRATRMPGMNEKDTHHVLARDYLVTALTVPGLFIKTMKLFLAWIPESGFPYMGRSLKQDEDVCVYLHDHGNHNGPSHKSSRSIISSLFYSPELEIVFLLLLCGMNSQLCYRTQINLKI